MNWTPISLKTLIPQLPVVLNKNFSVVEEQIKVFYNEDGGILIKPLNTTGRVKGATGEFVNVIVDNLTVKNQYTNLYDNNTTADYSWYTMYDSSAVVLRDPCTDLSNWPYEDPSYKYIDVNKPYYKISNEFPIALNNDNLSQVVGIYFDSSLIGTNDFEILMDVCTGETYSISSDMGGSYAEFSLVDYDASWGASWDNYKISPEEKSDRSKQNLILDLSTLTTWDLNESISAELTLEYDTTLDINNVVEGDTGIIVVKQDSIGSRSLYLPSGSLIPDGSFSLTTDASAVDVLSFYYNGDNYFWSLSTNYSAAPSPGIGSMVIGSTFVIS